MDVLDLLDDGTLESHNMDVLDIIEILDTMDTLEIEHSKVL
jgi:hypothetical protein